MRNAKVTRRCTCGWSCVDHQLGRKSTEKDIRKNLARTPGFFALQCHNASFEGQITLGAWSSHDTTVEHRFDQLTLYETT